MGHNMTLSTATLTRAAKVVASRRTDPYQGWPNHCVICKTGCLASGICSPCSDLYKRGLVMPKKEIKITTHLVKSDDISLRRALSTFRMRYLQDPEKMIMNPITYSSLYGQQKCQILNPSRLYGIKVKTDPLMDSGFVKMSAVPIHDGEDSVKSDYPFINNGFGTNIIPSPKKRDIKI